MRLIDEVDWLIPNQYCDTQQTNVATTPDRKGHPVVDEA